MGERIERADDRHLLRQADCQFGIVDHHIRQDGDIADRGLAAVFGLAEDRRHLRPGIGRRDRDLRHAGAQRDGLAKPGGRAAAEGDHAIRSSALKCCDRVFRHIDRRVHDRARKGSGAQGPKLACKMLRILRLMGRGQHQRPRFSEPADPFACIAALAGAEDDRGPIGLIDKFTAHGCPSCRSRTMTKVQSSSHCPESVRKRLTSSGRTAKSGSAPSAVSSASKRCVVIVSKPSAAM